MQATCVNLGKIQIKKIKALVWWINNHHKHGLSLDASVFTPDIICNAIDNTLVLRANREFH